MITSTQCRMARAAIKWTVAELATQANVSRSTVIRFERGEEVLPAINAALQGAFERAGIGFDQNGSVRPSRERKAT